MKPGDALRSIWFDNEDIAALRLPEENPCIKCHALCEVGCVKNGQVPIKELMSTLIEDVRTDCEIDIPKNEEKLKCDICGIPIENPFLLSSSVVASTYDMCARAFEAGWAGICFKTVCSLDIHEASPRFSAIIGD